jgi:hypothetical protein
MSFQEFDGPQTVPPEIACTAVEWSLTKAIDGRTAESAGLNDVARRGGVKYQYR